MGDLRHRLRLAEEARLLLLRGAEAAVTAGAEQLDRYRTLQLRVVGGVDHPHAALAHALDDGVAADGGALLERDAEGDDLRGGGAVRLRAAQRHRRDLRMTPRAPGE